MSNTNLPHYHRRWPTAVGPRLAARTATPSSRDVGLLAYAQVFHHEIPAHDHLHLCQHRAQRDVGDAAALRHVGIIREEALRTRPRAPARSATHARTIPLTRAAMCTAEAPARIAARMDRAPPPLVPGMSMSPTPFRAPLQARATALAAESPHHWAHRLTRPPAPYASPDSTRTHLAYAKICIFARVDARARAPREPPHACQRMPRSACARGLAFV